MSLSSSLSALRTLSRICNGETLLMTYYDIFSSHMNFGLANMGKRYEKNIYFTTIIIKANFILGIVIKNLFKIWKY